MQGPLHWRIQGEGAQGTRLPLEDQYFLNFRGFGEGGEASVSF